MKRIAGSALPVLAALTLGALAACGQPDLLDTAPPRSDLAEAPYARPAPAPSSTETPLLGAATPPRQAEPTGPWTMAPIPNPPEHRARERADAPRKAAQAAAKPATSKTVAPKPIAPRAAATTPAPATQKPAPVAPKPAMPAPTVAAPPAVAPTLKAERTPAPTLPVAPPVSAPKAAPAAAPGSPAAKLGQALAADISAGARLAIPDGLPNGYQGIVVLTLPNNLTARLQDEAQRLGLGEDAKVTDIRAVLTGQGYEIKPTADQMTRLGQEPVKFTWLVAEGSDRTIEKTPLRAEISGELHGGRVARSFPLASIGAVPAPLTQEAAKAASSTEISAKSLVFALPLLLILIALFILGRWAKARRDEKARRRAALEQFHT